MHRKHTLLPLAAVLTLVATLTVLVLQGLTSSAAVTCGGNATEHPAPYSCVAQRTIDGVPVRVHLQVNSAGSGQVSWTLPAGPYQFPVGVQAFAHTGLSFREGPIFKTVGAIKPGQTSLSLGIQMPSCRSQIDVKAQPNAESTTAHLSSKFRVTAPLVVLPGCGPSTTTTAPTTTTTTTAVTTTTPGPSTTSGPIVTTGLRTGTLVATGANDGHYLSAGLILGALGAVLLVLARLGRRPEPKL